MPSEMMPSLVNTQTSSQQARSESPNIVRRQGLVDRSKTIWALVNPNDYETTMQ